MCRLWGGGGAAASVAPPGPPHPPHHPLPLWQALALRDLGVGIAQLAEFAREEVRAGGGGRACRDLQRTAARPRTPPPRPPPLAPLQAFELSSPLDIAPFPVEKRMQRDPTWEEMGEAPPPHIPSWLPAFPDRHTYMHTVGFPGHDSDPHSVRMRMSEQRQQAEAALVRLGARLLPGNKLLAASLPQEEGAGEDEAAAPAAAAAAPEQPPAALDRGAAEQEKEAGAAAAEAPGAAAGPQSGNPFLAPVMWEDLPAQPLPAMEAVPAVAPAGAAGAEDAPASVANEGLAAGEAGGAWAAVEWEPSAGGTNFLPQQPQQPLFAGWDWTSQLQQRARMGAASGCVELPLRLLPHWL